MPEKKYKYITEEEYNAELALYRDIIADLLNYIDLTDFSQSEWKNLLELLHNDIKEFGEEIKKIPLRWEESWE